jgi:chromosomal replication initiation ATPase DnaA
MQQLVNIEDLPLVQKIIANAQQRIKEVTGTTVQLMFIGQSKNEKTQAKEILKQVIENEFGYSWDKIVSNVKKEDLVLARFCFSYVAVKKIKQSLTATAEDTKRKNHTSILHALSKCKNYLNTQCWQGEKINAVLKNYDAEIEKMLP